MSRIYCDANIIVPIFVREPNSARIESWMASSSVIPILSDLVLLEFASTISRMVRERKLDDERSKAIHVAFDDWSRKISRPLAVTRSMFAAARIIVERPSLGVRGPDALHLALATETGLPFATFDARLRAAAEALGLAIVDLPQP